MENTTCLTCGGPARTHIWKGYVCANCDQNKLLKEQTKIQKEELNLQYKLNGIKPPAGLGGLIASILLLPLKIFAFGIKNHKQIDEVNKSWMSFAIRHWKGILISFFLIIIFAAIVGSFQKH